MCGVITLAWFVKMPTCCGDKCVTRGMQIASLIPLLTDNWMIFTQTHTKLTLACSGDISLIQSHTTCFHSGLAKKVHPTQDCTISEVRRKRVSPTTPHIAQTDFS